MYKNENGEKNNNLFIIITFTIAIFLVILIVYLLFFNKQDKYPYLDSNQNSSIVLRAKPDNSYLFASPVRAMTGSDLIRVSVYLLNDYGSPIEGKIVKLHADKSIDIREIQKNSDSSGRAIFDLSSSTAGKFDIYFSVDGGEISNQKVTVSFD